MKQKLFEKGTNMISYQSIQDETVKRLEQFFLDRSRTKLQHGWDSRCNGEPFDPSASEDWKKGWLDCHAAKTKEELK